MKHLYSLVFMLFALSSSNLITAQIIPNVTYTNDNTMTCSGTASAAPTGGSGGYSYAWSTGETTSSIAGLCAGSYSVYIQDSNQDTVSFNFTITNPCSNLTVNLSTTNCTLGNCDGTIQLTVTGGSAPYTYNWSNGAGMTVQNQTNICPGTYSVICTDMNGCTTSANATVNAPCANFSGNITSTPASSPAICDGSIMFNPFNGAAPYTYIWNTGSTVQNNLNLCAGNYTVTCTDSNGCAITATGTIIDSSSTPTPLVVNLTSTDDLTNNCSGSASVAPTGGSGVYFVEWSTGATTNSISNLCAGIYSVLTWSTFYFDSTTVSFVIADSSSTYNNNPYPNGAINDTLYTDLVTNCIIDYNTIDSASLYQAVYNSSSQSLYVTWAVYSPTDTVYISDTLALIGNPGYYSLTISVYCPNKSINDFFKINDVIYFDGTTVWTSTLGLDEQHLLDNATIYPNPFSNSISVDNKDGLIQSVKLIDLNGRLISEMSNPNSGLVELNQLQSVSSGTYLLILSGENSSKTYKVIK
nr:T9SS type A sorting domain-containing protein [uncultured Fluviicola sp.]